MSQCDNFTGTAKGQEDCKRRTPKGQDHLPAGHHRAEDLSSALLLNLVVACAEKHGHLQQQDPRSASSQDLHPPLHSPLTAREYQ